MGYRWWQNNSLQRSNMDQWLATISKKEPPNLASSPSIHIIRILLVVAYCLHLLKYLLNPEIMECNDQRKQQTSFMTSSHPNTTNTGWKSHGITRHVHRVGKQSNKGKRIGWLSDMENLRSKDILRNYLDIRLVMLKIGNKRSSNFEILKTCFLTFQRNNVICIKLDRIESTQG